jgi:membrane associated rhomboid family serine protease
MALVGPIFGLQASAEISINPTLGQDISVAVIGAVVGMLFGCLIGTIQLWRVRRKSRASHSDSAV